MTDRPEMPATVASFLTDPAVRTAVEALLAVDADTLPPGLEWAELDTYYRARGGAELTRHDMAQILRQLWKTIWGSQIGPHLRPAPLNQMIDESYAVTPELIWDEKSFTVYHYQKPFVLYTDITLEPHQLSIAFSIEDKAKGMCCLRTTSRRFAGGTRMTKIGPDGRSSKRSAIRVERCPTWHLFKRRQRPPS